MKNILVFIFVILFVAQLKSQIISGKITSSNASEIVDYVNIGIKGKSFGTVSDVQGNFKIDLTGKADIDTVVFSHIGYFSYACTVKDVRSKSVNNQFDLKLKERELSLNEVVVRNIKTKVKWLGNEPSNIMKGNFLDDRLGSEFGTVFRFTGKRGRIKSVSMKIANCYYDSLCFRINVYNLKDGVPNENILKQPIYYKGLGKYPNGCVLSVNLEEQDIFIDQDFVVAFEWIKDMGKGGLNFPFTFLRSNTVSRKTSQDNWNKGIYGTGIMAEVEIEK